MNRGKGVILLIVAAGLAAAGLSLWFHYRQQQRILAFWGVTTAQLIAESPTVEVLRLDPLSIMSAEVPVSENPEQEENQPAYVEFAGEAWKVLEKLDASKAPGISNLRRSLVIDTTYDWRPVTDIMDEDEELDWQFALGFNDGKRWATVLFNLDTDRVAVTGGKKTVVLQAEASDQFLSFFLEQFPPASDTSSGQQPAEPPTETPAAASREAAATSDSPAEPKATDAPAADK